MHLTNLFLLLRRLLAFLYDSFLLLALIFVVTTFALFLNNGEAIESIFYKLALIPVAGFFYSWFWMNGGQTLGMRAWRIKLVNSNDALLTWKTCAVRFVIALLSFGFTWLFMLFNKDGDALHDRLSGTKIVIEKPNK